MASKRDYVGTAMAVRQFLRDINKIDVDRDIVLGALAVMVATLANQYEFENPNFDRKRFLDACGIGF